MSVETNSNLKLKEFLNLKLKEFLNLSLIVLIHGCHLLIYKKEKYQTLVN